jgi:hypothetical protein
LVEIVPFPPNQSHLINFFFDTPNIWSTKFVL